MKLLLVLFCSGCFYVGSAQKSLVVDLYTLGHFKRIHFYQGESITYKLKGSWHKQIHTLSDMEDSILYIETGESVRLDQIKRIIIDRSNFLTRMLASAFRIAGLGYIGLDAFNNGINAESPVFKDRVLVPGAILFVVGECIYVANKRRIHIGKNRRLQIMDFGLNGSLMKNNK
jgi:hypothetical protein